MNREIPIYLRVAETLRSRISQGLYLPGELLPPSRELELEFGVSNITIRRAVEILIADGLVESRRGRGTTVSEQNAPVVNVEMKGDFREWLASSAGSPQRFKAEVLAIENIAPPPRISSILGIDKGEEVWHMRRLRRLADKSISYYLNYGLPEFFSGVTAEAVVHRSFIEVFQENSGLMLDRLEQWVKAITADMDLSDLLEIPFGTPLFFVENIYFTRKDRPVEVTHYYLRGDRYSYRCQIDLKENKDCA